MARWFVVMGITALVATSLESQDTLKNKEVLAATAIATAVGPATVSVRAALPDGLSTGSGFIVDPAGTVITNFHVVEGATQVEIKTAVGDIHEVTAVRAVDQRRDIAVLQVAGFNLPTVQLGNSDNMRPGDRVVVIGNALGVLQNSVTAGIISGVRELNGSRLFQMDAATSSGNSGGPVVNEHAEVIGITVSKIEDGENLNFAVPVNYVRGLIRQDAEAGLSALQRLSTAKGLFDEESESQNASREEVWRSLTDGSVKVLYADEEYLYAETVLPELIEEAGGMEIAELREAENKLLGIVRAVIPCAYESKWRRFQENQRQLAGIAPSGEDLTESKSCTFQHAIEITSLTESRIEGTMLAPPDDAELKCKSCKFSKASVRQPFVWIRAN